MDKIMPVAVVVALAIRLRSLAEPQGAIVASVVAAGALMTVHRVRVQLEILV
jgi:hypothetical protein